MAPANRSEPRLELLLEPYDGRHAEVLKEIAAAVAPTAATLRQAVRLAEHERTIIAQGATWLLWTWLSAGARCTPKLAAELVARLPHLDDKWVMLHVTRCLPSLPLQPAEVDACCAFLRRGYAAKLPFLRAWAMDALHELSLRHERAMPVAREVLEAAADDPAKSVQARLRKVLGLRRR